MRPGQVFCSADLNNDLNVILGRCELLKQFLKGDSEAARQVEAIAEAARRMAETVRERVPGQPSSRSRRNKNSNAYILLPSDW
jgi:signal transduction histidine kinase